VKGQILLLIFIRRVNVASTFIFILSSNIFAVGIATGYGLDGLGIKSR
jgi:hypothetical protein